jgi:hypothetical protein
MRKIILTGLAVVVVIGVGAGVAVTKAGAHPDPEALFAALTGPQSDTGQSETGQMAPPGPADPDTMLLAQAGPPPGPGADMPPPPGMPGRPGPGWMHGGPPHAMGHHNLLALFFRPADKHLTAPDVQKIAEAFLLWNGNRDWKVTQVAAGSDGKIDFAFATADGGVIARFAMDSKTGRIERLG